MRDFSGNVHTCQLCLGMQLAFGTVINILFGDVMLRLGKTALFTLMLLLIVQT